MREWTGHVTEPEGTVVIRQMGDRLPDPYQGPTAATDPERELADTLGRALEQMADEGDGRHSTEAWVTADEALRQWREARKGTSHE